MPQQTDLSRINNFPRLSIVTPSFNQAEYLERTIRSILDQNYPNLEFFIVDGGSTDGSIEIIRKYSDRITWWVSERDDGQVAAINKGLKRATGDWIGWQNSDDLYYPGAFDNFAKMAIKNPKADLIIGDIILIDENDRRIREMLYVTPTYNSLVAEGMVLANQAAFWRRSLHRDLGFLNEKYQYSFDYEWFLRVASRSKSVHSRFFWGGFRLHNDTKSNLNAEAFSRENKAILANANFSLLKKFFYKLRRSLFLLASGNFHYLFRGIMRRFINFCKVFY